MTALTVLRGNELHLPTIVSIYYTVLLAGVVLFLQLSVRAVERTALRQLAASYFFIGIGSVVAGMGMHQKLSHAHWTVVTMFLGVTGYPLLVIGFRGLALKRTRYSIHLIAVLFLAVTAVSLFTEIWLNDRVRSAVFHITAGVSLLLSSVALFYNRRLDPVPSRLVLSIVLASGSAAFLLVAGHLIFADSYVNALKYGFTLQLFINFLMIIYTYGVVKDRIEERLRVASETDVLTGIGNRRWFSKVCPSRIMKGDGVMMIDIDHFKPINDTYGHQFGDTAIAKTAATIQQSLRSLDRLARYGGEEFVLFMSGVTRETLTDAAGRIREKVRIMRFEAPYQDVRITVSIGICWNDSSFSDMEQMQAAADAALYEAKTSGRDRTAAWPVGKGQANDLIESKLTVL